MPLMEIFISFNLPANGHDRSHARSFYFSLFLITEYSLSGNNSMTNVTESVKPYVCLPQRALQDERGIFREDRHNKISILMYAPVQLFSLLRLVMQAYLQI